MVLRLLEIGALSLLAWKGWVPGPSFTVPLSAFREYSANVPVYKECIWEYIDGQVFSYSKPIFYVQASDSFKEKNGGEQCSWLSDCT